MQWGLTVENAEHIKQTKTAGSWETLHGKQVTLNDSVSIADIPGLSFALCYRGLEPCEVSTPVLPPPPAFTKGTTYTRGEALMLLGGTDFCKDLFLPPKAADRRGDICRRQVTSEASSCQGSHSFAASKLLTSLGSFGEQSPGLRTSKQCCKGNQVRQHGVCVVIGSAGFTHASTHVPA